MAQITRNKKVLAGFLALSCACILGACDPVVATPTNYNDAILSGVEDDENTMGNIWNIVEGDKNPKVVETILDEIAKGKFGTYNEIMTSDADTFIKAHKDVFDNVESGTISAQEKARFENFKKQVNKRIQKAFYDLVTNTEYQDDDKKFDEEKLYDKLKEDWDLQPVANGFAWKNFYITNEVTEENALDLLHKELYSVSNETKHIDGEYNIDVKTRGYIEKKVFPQIVKDLLVEEYIYQNNKTALGRAYARNVNYSKISYTSENADFVKYITNVFVNENVYKDAGSNKVLSFEVINKAIKGFYGINSAEGAAIVKLNNDGGEDGAYAEKLNKSYFNYTLPNKDQHKEKIVVKKADLESKYVVNGIKIFDFAGDEIELYGDSELGKLVDKYQKALVAENLKGLADQEHKDALAYFNDEEEKTLQEKFRNKVLKLGKGEITQDGWFVKNGGLSELPMRDRLFSFNIADNLEDGFYLEKDEATYGNYRYKDGDKSKGEVKTTPYARNIHGRVFVMPEKPESWVNNKNNFVVDEGNALHICQVIEAPSSLKLQVGGSMAYKARGDKSSEVVIEEISREIAAILSTKSTYEANAYTEYLNAYEFNFNDSSLYDYFKGQYPDLEMFEEE